MFDKLYDTVLKCEQIEECPLYVCGVFFNTAMETMRCLDWERIGGGAGFLYDDTDLEDMLHEYGIGTTVFAEALEALKNAFEEV